MPSSVRLGAVLLMLVLTAATAPAQAGRQSARTPAAAGQDTRWFASNLLGMPLAEVSSPFAGGEYVLESSDLDPGTRYRLLRDGDEVWTRVHTPVPAGLRIEEFRADILVRVAVRDPGGRLLEERFLEAGETVEALYYTWSQDRVQSILRQLEAQNDTYAYSYSRRRFGPTSVVDLSALLDPASGEGYRFALSADGLYRLALIGGSGGYVSGLAGSARLQWRLSLDADGARTEWDYGPDGALVQTRSTEPDGTVIVDRYRDEQVVERLTLQDGRQISREEFSRDAGGNLTSRRLVAGVVREEWTWDPAEGQDGTERYYRNGVLMRQITREGNREVETRYRDGAAVLRITRVDGRRVREESIRDGEVVSEREYS